MDIALGVERFCRGGGVGGRVRMGRGQGGERKGERRARFQRGFSLLLSDGCRRCGAAPWEGGGEQGKGATQTRSSGNITTLALVGLTLALIGIHLSFSDSLFSLLGLEILEVWIEGMARHGSVSFFFITAVLSR
jgi:hypothetical protein